MKNYYTARTGNYVMIRIGNQQNRIFKISEISQEKGFCCVDFEGNGAYYLQRDFMHIPIIDDVLYTCCFSPIRPFNPWIDRCYILVIDNNNYLLAEAGERSSSYSISHNHNGQINTYKVTAFHALQNLYSDLFNKDLYIRVDFLKKKSEMQ